MGIPADPTRGGTARGRAVIAAARKVRDECNRELPSSQYAVDEALAELDDALQEYDRDGRVRP